MRVRVDWVVPIVVGVLAVMGLTFGARALLTFDTGEAGAMDVDEAQSQLDSDDFRVPPGFEFVRGWHGKPAFTGSTGYAVRFDGPRPARVRAEDLSHLLSAWEPATCDPKTGEVARFGRPSDSLDVHCTGTTTTRISHPRHDANHLKKVTVIELTDADTTTLYVHHAGT